MKTEYKTITALIIALLLIMAGYNWGKKDGMQHTTPQPTATAEVHHIYLVERAEVQEESLMQMLEAGE